MYETLMPHGLGGGRAPTVARRRFVAERAGTSTSALDDARRELLAPAPGGPYLSRSAPRGAKRSVKHAARRLPRQTGEVFVPVPTWTLNLVWAGRRRPAGRVSPEVWRLYVVCVDRACRASAPRTFETTVSRLGAALHASPDTGRRRLAELEAAGLVRVTEQSGGWLLVDVVFDARKAAEVAETYARNGRRRVKARRDPSHVVALTPGKNRDSPVADSGTPQESPPSKTAPQESHRLPVRDEKTRRSAWAGATAVAKKSRTSSRRRRTPGRLPRGAVEVYRALPVEVTRRVSEQGSRRVLEAIAAELEHRSPVELAERVTRNWEHWRWRLSAGEPVRDPVALTIRLTRRGLACPDVRCEDGHQLDLDASCKACALTAAERAAPLESAANEPPGPSSDAAVGSRRGSSAHLDGEARGGERSVVAPAAVAATETKRADGRVYGALARELLKARSDAERDAILAAHQASAHSA